MAIGGSAGPAARLATVLSCLAIDRRLSAVLVIDLPPGVLPALARWLGDALVQRGGARPEVVTLGATNTEDDLWWRPAFGSVDGRFALTPAQGLLVDPPDGPERTVIVPDLARAGLAVVRAAVALIGADTATMERHGQRLRWRPRARWLAACARSDLGRLSPHLLDRFAVRVDAADLTARPDARGLIAALDAADDDVAALDLPAASLPPGEPAALPALHDAAADLVVGTIRGPAVGSRRELALARTARALAALDRRTAVSTDHVREAAALLGLAPAATGEPKTPPPPAKPAEPPGVPAEPDGDPTAAHETGPADATRPGMTPIPAELDDVGLPPDPLPPWNYPEDEPGALAEYTSLRAPWQRRSTPRQQRGPVIGVEPTRTVSDLAVVATAFEAAKFQRIRREAAGHGGDGLVIGPSDLRRFRRLPEPDSALVLVLDHTCRRNWDWSAALGPYLRWAYARRAALTVVELGHRDCVNELRAERYRATSVLDPRVSASLQRAHGRATPLASALDLAVQELRRLLRRGRAGAEQAWLVVATDGRGNVPLAASQRGTLAGSVGRAGITDALAVAATVRTLPTARTVVLAPPALTFHAGLPFDLAVAMHGIVADLEASP